MEKTMWTYQQYHPETGTFTPIPPEVTHGVPEGYEIPILQMFQDRDQRRCKRSPVLRFPRKGARP